MTVPTSDSPQAVGSRTAVVGSAASLGLAVVVLGLWESWASFPRVWSDNRGHGFAVAAAVMWLLWRDREVIMRAGVPAPLASLPLLAASLVWMVGVAISAQVIQLFMVPVILVGWHWTTHGARAAIRALPMAALFTLAVPIWEVLLPVLQQATIIVNTVAIRIAGIDAQVTGQYIRLANGVLEIAEGCAGLNYLLSALTLGATYTLLFRVDGRARLKIIATAAGLAIVSNWIRVFGLVMIAYVTDMRSPLIQSHGFYGWVIFACTLPIFGWLAARIERHATAHAAGRDEASAGTGPAAIVSPRVALIASSAALAGPASLFLLHTFRMPAATPAELQGLSPAASWSAIQKPDTLWHSALGGFTSRITTVYRNESRFVQVDRFVFREQSQGSEMVGGGNRVAPDSTIVNERVAGPLDDSLRTVRETIIKEGRGFRLLWWWYRVGGTNTPVALKAQLLELWSLLSGAPPAELVIVSSPCGERDCQSALASLYEVTVGRQIPQVTPR